MDLTSFIFGLLGGIALTCFVLVVLMPLTPEERADAPPRGLDGKPLPKPRR